MARRRYQKGSLKLRGDKWIGRWREDEIRDGRVFRINRKLTIGTKADFPTKRLAQRELDSRLAGINNPTYQPLKAATFERFAEQWKAHALPQMKLSTQASVKSVLTRCLMPTFGELALRDISTFHVQSFVSTASGASKSIRNAVVTLRSMWKDASAWGYVSHNPFQGLRLPPVVKGEQPFFSPDQMKQIIQEAKEPYKTFFWLAAETGMRAGELCGLRWEDVDLESGIVRVRQSVWRGTIGTPKSSAGTRAFAISPMLTGALQGQRGDRLSGLLFTTRNGTPWDANLVVKRKLHPILRRLGIERAGLHAFRHGNETMMDRNQTPVALRLGRLGHADTRMMVNYSHVISQDDRQLADKFGTLLNPNALQRQESATSISESMDTAP